MNPLNNMDSQDTLGNKLEVNSYVSSNEETEIEDTVIDITSKTVNELKQRKQKMEEDDLKKNIDKVEIDEIKKYDESDERYVAYEVSGGKLYTITFALCIITLLACLDMTIISTALPTIIRDFGDISGYSWVITAYMLSSTAFQPIYGKMADIFGRRSNMLFALAIFTISSALCGVANSMNMLIVFRGIQGIGGGGLMSLCMIIIADIIPIRRRGQYMGILGAVFSFSTVVGPLVGGLFTDHLSWRWAFYINIPLALISMVIIFLFVRIPTKKGNLREKLLRVDYAGTVVMIACVVSLLLALEWGGVDYEWNSYQIILLFVIFALLLVVFIVIEIKFAKEPIIPPEIFKVRNIVCMIGAVILIGFSFMGSVTYLPLYFQMVLGLDASISGLRMTPMSIVVTILSISSGMFIGKYGRVKYLFVIGFVLAASSGYFYSTFDMDTGLWTQLLIIAYGGVGMGLVRQNLILVAQDCSPKKLLSSVTAIMSFFQVIGGIVGIAVFNTVLNNRVPSKLHEYEPSIKAEDVDMKVIDQYGYNGLKAYCDGLSLNFLFIIPCSLLALVCSLLTTHVRLNKRPQKHNTKDTTCNDVNTVNMEEEMSEKPVDGSTVVDLVENEKN